MDIFGLGVHIAVLKNGVSSVSDDLKKVAVYLGKVTPLAIHFFIFLFECKANDKRNEKNKTYDLWIGKNAEYNNSLL